MEQNYITQLKEIIQAGGISQRQLAKHLGITFPAVNRWINGRAKPHPKRIAQIEQLYKELVDYPSVSESDIRTCVKRAAGLKRNGIWTFIAKNQQLQDELLLEHTYNSTAIEGTTFSKRETEAVIFSRRVIADKSLVEHLEVTNHASVLRDIFQRKIKPAVSETLIKTIHKGLLQGIRGDAGSYAKHHRAIRGVEITLTHPKDISEEMSRLMRSWKSKAIRKTIREIAQFHADFEMIHPFGDGNGRVGRLLMTIQCLQASYPPVVIENARKAEYYDVLEYAQRKSIGPFAAFLFDEMAKTSKMIRKYTR